LASLAGADAGPALMPNPHAAHLLGAFGWAKALRLDMVGWTQQERRAFVSLCQKRHVYLQGSGTSYRGFFEFSLKI